MNAVAAALYTALAGGTALTALLTDGTAGIYHMQAPESAVLPYAVFSKQGGGPENIDPHDRRDLTYYVRGYATDDKTAGQIDAACEGLLHKKNLSVSGWRTVWCVRETDIELVENPSDGVPIYAAGGFYRIRIV